MAKTLESSTAVATNPDSFGSLKRYAVDYVQGGDDPELLDIAGRAINKAIDRLNTRNWKKNTQRQRITTTLDLIDYTINKDVKEPRALGLTNLDQYPNGRLGFKSYKTMESEHPVATSPGTPKYYTVYYVERLLSLDTRPNQAFVDTHPYMMFRYFRRIPYLVADSDQLLAPSEMSSFVGWESRFDLAAVRGESSLSKLAAQKAFQAWTDLLADDADTATDWSEP